MNKFGLQGLRKVNDGTHPPATHDIVDVVAKLFRTGTDASPNTEFVVRNEFSPFVILQASTERVAV